MEKEKVGEREGPGEDLGDLPTAYGETNLVFMPVDPEMLYVYWEFNPEDLRKLRMLEDEVILRIRRVPQRPGRPDDFSDLNVRLEERSFLFVPVDPEGKYIVELGLKREDAFFPLTQSGRVELPPARPTPRADSEGDGERDLTDSSEKAFESGVSPRISS